MKFKINYDICAFSLMFLSIFLICSVFYVYDKYGLYFASFNVFLAIVFCGLNYICLKKGTDIASKEVDDLIAQLKQNKENDNDSVESKNIVKNK